MKSSSARLGPLGLVLRLSLVVVLFAAVWAGIRLWPRKMISVRVVPAVVGTVRDVVSSSSAGEVSPEQRATLRAELAGRVVAVRAKRGDRVKLGELIVSIDPADLDARLRQAQAALDAATAQRSQAEARLHSLRRQAERARLLAQGGAGPITVSEDANAMVEEGESGVRAADGQKAQALASLQLARVQRARADFVAPFDGLLTEVVPNVGDSLTLSAPVLELIADSRLHVDATVDEADAARVRLEQPAELRLDALPGRTFAGKVARVDPVVKRDLKGARTLTVEVEVSDTQTARAAGLKPGMSANVEIIVAEKQNVLSVPANVIVGRGVNRFVYVVEPEDNGHRSRRRTISVGLANWDRAEVLSGLTPGARLVASLNEKGLDDGARVTPVDLAPAAP